MTKYDDVLVALDKLIAPPCTPKEAYDLLDAYRKGKAELRKHPTAFQHTKILYKD